MLYETTGGPWWRNNSGWMQGEPCVDQWFGITCCPQDFPDYQPKPVQQCQSEDECNKVFECRSQDGFSAVPPPVTPGAVHPNGCSSGNVTGNVAFDYATCVVVKISLPNNNLTGTLSNGTVTATGNPDTSLCALGDRVRVLELQWNGGDPDDPNYPFGGLYGGFPDNCFMNLISINLEDNSFWGRFPTAMLQEKTVRDFRLDLNYFSYPTDTNTDEEEQQLRDIKVVADTARRGIGIDSTTARACRTSRAMPSAPSRTTTPAPSRGILSRGRATSSRVSAAVTSSCR